MKVNGSHHTSIWAVERRAVGIIDQTQLPFAWATLELDSHQAVIDAMRTMKLRGAPLIGVAGAYGLALAMNADPADAALVTAYDRLLDARPTAVNLRWALERMRSLLTATPIERRANAAWQEADRIAAEDVELNRALGAHGAKLIAKLHTDQRRPINILTHCNTGWIATVDYGTALSAIYQAHDAGVPLHVWVDETRPRNQGLLTAWELRAHGVPHTLIVDNAGGHLMQRGAVDMVLVGADRVSAQGDVCNKIGTYLKALAAHDNGVPFYAAVPSPTIDWTLRDAFKEIPIEDRGADEVRQVIGIDGNQQRITAHLANEETSAANPAFDVTPGRLVTGIITERGIATPARLSGLFSKS